MMIFSSVSSSLRAYTGSVNVTAGVLAGLLAGAAYGLLLNSQGLSPVGSEAALSNEMLFHLVISLLAGAGFALMFGGLIRTLGSSDIYSVGSSIAWGATYGLIWWMLGPLTLMPWLLGQGLQWNLEAAQSAFPSLIGHVIYGVVLALAYSLLNQIWRTLFVDSDPLLREPEGPGTRSLRALGTGMMASVLGGLLFTVVMMATDALPLIAQLVGLASTMAGFVVHMVISSIIGATYGLLFQKEVLKPSQALGWGLIYGLIWWFVGPLTLMPVLLGEPLQWSIAAAQINFPSLIGHLVYGMALGLGHYHLLRQYKPRVNKKRRKQSAHDIQTAAGVSAALWVSLALLVLILVPVLTAA